MFVAWVVFHVIICFALIVVVLMQSAKGEGLAGGTAFGGGVSTAVFGGRGAASFLSKATTVLAVVFFVNCGALAFMSSSSRVSVAAGTGDGTSESAVTQRAQQERDEALRQQQQMQDQVIQDSLAQQNSGFNLDSVMVGEPADEGATETPEQTPSGN